MYFFGGLNALAMIICYWCIPNGIGKTMSSKQLALLQAENESLYGLDDNSDEDIEKFGQSKKITWCQFLGNKSVFFSLVMVAFGTFNLVFFSGYIATELVSLHLDPNSVGYIMAL
jgi:hypothetical protein